MCYSSPSVLVMEIFEVEIVEIWCGRLLRPWLYSRLAHTAMPAHFQGHTSPKAGIPPYFDDYRALQVTIFVGDQDFHGRHPLRPWL